MLLEALELSRSESRNENPWEGDVNCLDAAGIGVGLCTNEPGGGRRGRGVHCSSVVQFGDFWYMGGSEKSLLKPCGLGLHSLGGTSI